MKLGIVGSEAAKFLPYTEAIAKSMIQKAIQHYKPDGVVSGRCPLGGIDVWAEDIALDMGLKTLIYAPKVFQWSGTGGYRERNLKIARASDLVLVMTVDQLPDTFKGLKFSGCYHCRPHDYMCGGQKIEPHVKSGACWTAWQAVKMGKKAVWQVIPQVIAHDERSAEGVVRHEIGKT